MYFRNLMSMDPWREMDRIQREMNRLFEETGIMGRTRAYPAMNIWTNEEAAMVTAELAGYQPNDIQISVVGNELTLRGNRPRIELREGEQFHRRERRYGEFERTIRLPFEVEGDKVEARFHHGVLNVVLPRAETEKPRKIQIKTS